MSPEYLVQKSTICEILNDIQLFIDKIEKINNKGKSIYTYTIDIEKNNIFNNESKWNVILKIKKH